MTSASLLRYGLSSKKVASRVGLNNSTVLKHARKGHFRGAKRIRGTHGPEWRFTVEGVIRFNKLRGATRRG